MHKKNPLLRAIVLCLFISPLLACNLYSTPAAIPSTPEIKTAPLDQGMTSATLTLVTGSDGTNVNPVFELYDGAGAVVFSVTLDNPGDLQPNQTDIYEFSVPKPFCQIVMWMLQLPAAADADPWQPISSRIDLNGVNVWWDGSLSSYGPFTSSEHIGGNWLGIDVYQQQCGN